MFDDFRMEGNFEECSGRLAWSKQQHGVVFNKLIKISWCIEARVCDIEMRMFWGGNGSHELSAGGTS